MIYIFDELDKVDDEYLKNCEMFLSAQRKAKVKRLKTFQGKLQSTMVYILLRHALHLEYAIDEAVIFEYNENRKPYLKDYPHIYFSLSHCKSAVACTISESEIGVDIQDIRPVTDRLAKRVLTDNEYNEFLKSTSPDEYFCKIWTIKEAYLKKTGQGIGSILSEIDTNKIKDITLVQDKNYYCCATESDMNVRRYLYER